MDSLPNMSSGCKAQTGHLLQYLLSKWSVTETKWELKTFCIQVITVHKKHPVLQGNRQTCHKLRDYCLDQIKEHTALLKMFHILVDNQTVRKYQATFQGICPLSSTTIFFFLQITWTVEESFLVSYKWSENDVKPGKGERKMLQEIAVLEFNMIQGSVK